MNEKEKKFTEDEETKKIRENMDKLQKVEEENRRKIESDNGWTIFIIIWSILFCAIEFIYVFRMDNWQLITTLALLAIYTITMSTIQFLREFKLRKLMKTMEEIFGEIIDDVEIHKLKQEEWKNSEHGKLEWINSLTIQDIKLILITEKIAFESGAKKERLIQICIDNNLHKK